MSQASKFGQVNLNVDNDAALIFQHRLVDGGKPLTIRSGANQIIWGYSLLTKVTPTYGGEVQQILGARIEQLEINGNTRDNHQLEQIYDWFRAYMTLASGYGAGNKDADRSEVPIVFSYPARKWQFDIQVFDATGFQIGTGLVATPWQIKAIIVPTGEDQIHILEKITLDPLTSVLLPATGIPIGIGYNDHNQYSDAAYSGSDVTFETLGRTIGDNFHRLLGAYSVGDFSHFAFEGAAPSAFNSLNQEAKDYYTSIYGTNVINTQTQGGGGQELPGGAGSGGSSGSFQYKQGQTKWPGALGAGSQFDTVEAGPAQLEVVAWMASNALAAGLPPELPIMAALTESSLRNLTGGDADSKGFFQMRTSVWDSGTYAGYPTDPDLQMLWFITQANAHKSQFPGAQKEATRNAENLGQWCQAVEVSAHPDRYQANYQKAVALLNQSKVAIPNPAGPGGTTQGTAATGPGTASLTGGYSGIVSTTAVFAGCDQGVDFTGGGAIYALADSIVTRVDSNSGWPGGWIIAMKMTSGSRANGDPTNSSTTPFWYVAENLIPVPGIKVGQRFRKGEKITDFSASYPYCEIGFAQNDHGSAFGTIHDGKSGGPTPVHGQKMQAYMQHVSGGGQ